MSILQKITPVLLVCSAILISCAPNMTRIKEKPPVEEQKVQPAEIKGDTLNYTLEFKSPEEREKFLKYYNEYMKDKQVEGSFIDSSENSVHIKVPSGVEKSDSSDSMSFGMVERSRFIESVIESAMERAQDTLDSLSDFSELFDDSIQESPVRGGKIRMYVQRGFLDNTISEMIRMYPFAKSETDSTAPFVITDSSYRRLELKLSKKLTKANGQVLTALDFIEIWSKLAKNQPAEGLALFRNVQGMEQFISGEEPLVKGFNAVDEKTIQIRFSKPDSLNLKRLRTSRLLWNPFMLGTYYISGRKDGEVRLSPNRKDTTGAPYLDEMIVKTGGDANAVLSFSLGRFSLMEVNSISDIQFAKTDLAETASLKPYSSDRYFISCHIEDQYARTYIKSIVDAEEMLSSLVKVEGEKISSVDSVGELSGIAPVKGPLQAPILSKPVRIIYLSEDPVSKTVAEKLMADLTNTGMICELKGAEAKEYEYALFRGEYECAVGWVSDDIFTDETERLRLASMWFSDMTDSYKRISENREIPLFTVKNYLLIRDDVRLNGKELKGIWIKDSSASNE